MYKFITLLTLALVFTACTKHEAVATEKQASTTLDTVITNFSLPDINGKTHSLTDYKSSKAIVLMFISTECPVSNAYNSRMAAISKDYSSKDITFLGINSNKAEDVAAITKHAAENGLDFTILKDNGNVVADQLAASFTPEIYVLSGDLKLLYHGRIDDKRRLEEVTSNDLQKALDEILAGKPVSVSSTKAFGCTIKRVD
ncbi:MAG: thioredoxin family protein [Ignavibacteriales bacterium]|jgi:peroxiredoxin|nr:thioredoxin family protein [Ignavibacteriales bacterium]MBK8663926.1 thioredoxin family protein [Ignavibacteriales bacterium]MBP9926319.1 thioredoxin family protein [Cyclobacteriaceae bacterium]